jgi:acyl-CoA reductase-like NAD-dependent aldehyde dehydrogenase
MSEATNAVSTPSSAATSGSPLAADSENAPRAWLNLIDGEWRPSRSGRTFENVNPADTRDLIGLVQSSGPEDVNEAVEAAARAFPGWAATPPPVRGRVLLKAAHLLDARLNEVADLLSREEGKTIAEGKGEVTRAVRILEYFAGEGSRFSGDTIPSERPRVFMYTIREPLGVVALIAPWNFPIAIPAWKLAPALVSGNTVVIKPASQAPLTAVRLVEILHEAGIPKGVLNLVTGSGRDVGDPLVAHPKVRAISFTGSDAVGRTIARKAAERLARVQLEMGGKNPTIVLADADLDTAVDCVLNAAFYSTGQRCTATSRAIVERPILDAFLDRLRARTEKLRIGDPRDPATDIGPAIDAGQLETTLRYLQQGQADGAALVYGGERLTDASHAHGHFSVPAIMTGVRSDSRLGQEEVFGPLLAVMEVADYDEAVRVANDVRFGLSASICTNNLSRAIDYVHRAEAGMIMVNLPSAGVEYHIPFGGMKDSSSGMREQGPAAIEFFSETKTAYLKY